MLVVLLKIIIIETYKSCCNYNVFCEVMHKQIKNMNFSNTSSEAFYASAWYIEVFGSVSSWFDKRDNVKLCSIKSNSQGESCKEIQF